MNGVDAERLAEAAAQLRAQGHGCCGAAFDVCRRAAVDAAFERLDAEGIAIDILVNNAGIQYRKPMLELEPPTGGG